MTEQFDVSAPKLPSVQVADGLKVPPVGLIVNATVPCGAPLLGVGAVSVSVTVHCVVPAYTIGLGLQVIETETVSLAA